MAFAESVSQIVTANPRIYASTLNVLQPPSVTANPNAPIHLYQSAQMDYAVPAHKIINVLPEVLRLLFALTMEIASNAYILRAVPWNLRSALMII